MAKSEESGRDTEERGEAAEIERIYSISQLFMIYCQMLESYKTNRRWQVEVCTRYDVTKPN